MRLYFSISSVLVFLTDQKDKREIILKSGHLLFWRHFYKDEGFHLPLGLATYSGSIDTIRYVLQCAKDNGRDYESRYVFSTLVQTLVIYGHTRLAKFIFLNPESVGTTKIKYTFQDCTMCITSASAHKKPDMDLLTTLFRYSATLTPSSHEKKAGVFSMMSSLFYNSAPDDVLELAIRTYNTMNWTKYPNFRELVAARPVVLEFIQKYQKGPPYAVPPV